MGGCGWGVGNWACDIVEEPVVLPLGGGGGQVWRFISAACAPPVVVGKSQGGGFGAWPFCVGRPFGVFKKSVLCILLL